MDAVHDLAEQDCDEMRQEIDCTRSAMADKLGALEDRVMDTVHSAQETVQDSIQSAKDTVATVKRNFDVKYQVEQRPWAMVGGCFLAGLALGSVLQGVRLRSRQTPDRLAVNETTLPGNSRLPAEQHSNGSVAAAAPSPRLHGVPPSRPGIFDRFQDEIDKAKGMAIGYVMGLVRDSIKESLPQLASQIDGVMNGVTTKIGGEPSPSSADSLAKV
jgi:ElaB/YqjD/DUF883 family membrane-anchored ribosome-binding protein